MHLQYLLPPWPPPQIEDLAPMYVTVCNFICMCYKTRGRTNSSAMGRDRNMYRGQCDPRSARDQLAINRYLFDLLLLVRELTG